MRLEIPNKGHKKNYEELVSEWKEYEDISDIAPWALFYWENFEDFLTTIEEYKTNSPTGVNSSLFFLLDNDYIVWAIDIRHTIDSPILKEIWGHIWYGISPKYRKKWYATKILELWLIETKKLWIKEVLMTCTVDNIASIKVIEKNLWVFERKSKFGNFNRYLINL